MANHGGNRFDNADGGGKHLPYTDDLVNPLVVDEGLTGQPGLPERWTLVARAAGQAASRKRGTPCVRGTRRVRLGEGPGGDVRQGS